MLRADLPLRVPESRTEMARPWKTRFLTSVATLLMAVATQAEDLEYAAPSLFTEQAMHGNSPASQVRPRSAGRQEEAYPQQLGIAQRISSITQGRVQLEGGYIFTYDRVRDVSVAEHAIPDLLLRIGLTERLELRIGWPGYRSVDYGGAWGDLSYEETLDPNVGFMFDLWEQRGLRPQTAFSAALPIALEDDPLVFDSLQPAAQILYLWYLDDRWSIGGTTGLGIFEESGDRYAQFQQSLGADCLLTDWFGGFVQWTALVDHRSEEDGSQHLLSGGLSALWTERFQSTLEIGVGLNERAPDFLTALRFAFRF